jgi:hypothetical protein
MRTATVTIAEGTRCAHCNGWVPLGFQHLPVANATSCTTGPRVCFLVRYV